MDSKEIGVGMAVDPKGIEIKEIKTTFTTF